MPENRHPSSENETSFESRWRVLLQTLLEELKVPEHFPAVFREVSHSREIQRLRACWWRLHPEDHERHLAALVPLLRETALRSRPYCVRCGQCCSNSSPTMYEEDLQLIQSDVLRACDLLTLRRGEWGYSHMEECPVILDGERIKIKEKPPGGACRFYDKVTRSCRIYEHRPIQCRHQACWAPAKILDLLREPPLKRVRVIQKDHPLRGLIEAHEERCGIEMLRRAIAGLERSDQRETQPIFEILQWDLSLRDLVADRQLLDQGEFEFYFGRPLIDLLPPMGYSVKRTPEGGHVLFKMEPQ